MSFLFDLLLGKPFSLRKVLSRIGHPPAGEDRWAVNETARRWVLCDGASEGWDPGGWAETVAAVAAEHGLTDPGFAAGLKAASRDSSLPPREAPPEKAALPDWLARSSSLRGSGATVLLAETDRTGKTLTVQAVGDTCLMLLEGYALQMVFPLEKPEEFTDFPPLVSSRVSSPDPASPDLTRPVETTISLRTFRDPVILLATDGIAEYLTGLEAGEKREALFRFFSSLGNEEFIAWAEEEVRLGRLKDDDITLLWIDRNSRREQR